MRSSVVAAIDKDSRPARIFKSYVDNVALKTERMKITRRDRERDFFSYVPPREVIPFLHRLVIF